MTAPSAAARHVNRGFRPTYPKKCAESLRQKPFWRTFAAENEKNNIPHIKNNNLMATQNTTPKHAHDDNAEQTQVINNNACCDDERTVIINEDKSREQAAAPAAGQAKGKGERRSNIAAGVAAAAAVGGGVGYAAAHMHGEDAADPDGSEEVAEGEPVADVVTDGADADAPARRADNAGHPAEKPAVVRTQQPAAHDGHEAHDVPEPSSTFDFVGVETMTDAEGNEVKIVDATVNGHNAIFMADEEGNVLNGVIDVNDNGEIDDDEILKFDKGSVTIDDLAKLDNVGEKPDIDLIYASGQQHGGTPAHEVAENEKFDVLEVEEVNDNGTVTYEVAANAGGHEAAFVADAEGNLIVGAIDVDDDGELDQDEIIDFKDSGATLGDLIAHDNVNGVPDIVKPIGADPVILADVQTAEVVDPEDVKILGVADDVILGGEVVDVAFAEVEDVPVVLVDATQDGMADVLVADINGNAEVDSDEVFDVTGEGIEMPPMDGLSGDFADGGVADYNNDADVGYYDV